MGTDSRIDWQQRDFTSRTVLSRCPSTNWNRRLLPSANVVLVEPLRCLPPFSVCWRVVLSLILIAGFLPTATLIGLWMFYLSLVTVGQAFLSFQWDVLLLEAGLLAIFFAPLRIRDAFTRVSETSGAFLWLLRWLLFRLMFASGFVKLASDAVWRDLTALNFHYETQPLPTWIGWYAHQLPEWLHKLSVIGMFTVELAVPFLIFAPRRLRTAGCIGLIGLQVLILLTGNYCFFNLLTIALCLLLIDDVTWKSLLSKRFMPSFQSAEDSPHRYRRVCIAAVAMLLFVLSGVRFGGQLFRDVQFPDIPWIRPFRSVNTYGLFADMTESRPEIIVEGSNDRITWEPTVSDGNPVNSQLRPNGLHRINRDWIGRCGLRHFAGVIEIRLGSPIYRCAATR